MKIISWNVNGIRSAYKKGFLNFLENEKPDIMCIQETKAHKEQLNEELINPPSYESFFSSAEKKGYSGTLIYVKKNIKLDQVKTGIGIKEFDSEGRFVNIFFKDFILYNIYFPNGAAREERHLFKQRFLKSLNKHLKKDLKTGKKVIVLGDYNVAYLDHDVFDPKRLSKTSGFLPEERKWFLEFLKLGFTDSFRHFYPDLKDKYTWWSMREMARFSNRGWRIDHICVSENLKSKMKKSEIMDHIEGSDHCPIILELK